MKTVERFLLFDFAGGRVLTLKSQTMPEDLNPVQTRPGCRVFLSSFSCLAVSDFTMILVPLVLAFGEAPRTGGRGAVTGMFADNPEAKNLALFYAKAVPGRLPS